MGKEKKKFNVLEFLKTPQGFIVLLITGILVGSTMMAGPLLVSGYDGITAEIIDIESNGVIENFGADASVMQDDYWAILFKDPTGVNIEIDAAVDVLTNESYGDPIEQRVENADGTDTLKYWDVKIVKCSMGITIVSSGGGLDPATDIVYTIKLTKNFFSIFTEFDESYAFIFEVYTLNYTNTVGIVDVIPSSGGYTFPLTTVRTGTIPSWFKDSGYNVASLSALEEVSFDIKLKNIQPESFLGLARTESQAIFDIGIDVFLVGYWEKTVARGWSPEPIIPWYDGLLGILDDIMEGATGPLVMIAIIAITALVGIVIFKSIVLGAASKLRK